MSAPRLTDLFPLPSIQALQDSFAHATSASIVIVDPQGERITAPSNWNGFCGIFNHRTAPDPACLESICDLLTENMETGTPSVADCPHTGLTTAAVPILLGEHFLGSWVFGQMRFHTPPEDMLVKTAGELSLPLEEIHGMLHALPDFSHTRFETMFQFIEQLNSLLVQLGSSNQQVQLREQELHGIAFFHKYTGLPNSAKLSQDLASGICVPGEVYMICMHLSSMRYFNEVYGRKKGYELMTRIGQWCSDQDCFGGTLYNLEGYAFCLLLQNTGRQAAIDISDVLQRRFNEPWPVCFNDETIPYTCTASMSLICLEQSMLDEDILNLIDRTLYVSRKSNTLFIYDDMVDREAKEHIRFEMTLRSCIKNAMQGFAVYFQPIAEASTGVWKGLEALCRWTSPHTGPVSPGVFIPEAEQLGLISTLGDWVLETAIRVCKELGLDLLPDFFLSVNISSLQMMDEDFAENVARILQRHDFPGSKLNLEITESTEISFTNFTLSIIDSLGQLGIRMALDDFGTGYSSFNSLKNLPVSFLKTERAFIENIEKDDYLQYYLYIMAEIAHANQMQLIAEGIETREQYHIIKSNGADFMQGYYFSRPMSGTQLQECLAYFHPSPERLVPPTQKTINIGQWLDGKTAYTVTPSLFKLLNGCMRTLLADADVGGAFQQVLEVIGSHFRVSNAFVLLCGPALACSRMHEWCAQGAPSLIPYIDRLDDAAVEVLETQFRQDGMLIASDIAQLSPRLREIFAALETRAIALLPMWQDGSLEGLLGFHNQCRREWQPEEVVMLWNLGMLMQGTLHRAQLQSSVTEKQLILGDVMNNTGLNIYISDPETGEILWVNNALKRRYAIGPSMVGQKCYEVIQGRTEHCPFCKVAELLHNPQQGQISFEHHNERWDRDFLVYDGLIPWEDGRQVHIQYSLDVTDYHKTQQQLEYLAATDALTGVMNRRALLDQLQQALQLAHTDGRTVTIAYLDIDMLKDINDAYGHHIGDQALRETAQALRGSIRAEDVIGRIGGDEFVVMFSGCEEAIARKRLLRATSRLDSHRFGIPLSFSFGFADNQELPYEAGSTYVDALLQLADSRMLDRKQHKQAHAASQI